VAKWDGNEWSDVDPQMDGVVLALTVFDDGNGFQLYAGGTFTNAGGQIVNHVAKYDGADWTPVGGGTNGDVQALAVLDVGTGPELYAAGEFTAAGGTPAFYIAKWDGTTWSALDGGLGDEAHAMTVFDDGTGTGFALFVGGGFAGADGETANGVATWRCGFGGGGAGGGCGLGIFGGLTATMIGLFGTGLVRRRLR
jgi:hypothetical protein